MSDSVYVHVPSSRFVVEHLPDGSAAVFDTASDAAHSLNAAAVLAWDTCEQPARAADVELALREAGATVDATTARDTLARLAEIGLVASTTRTAPVRTMPRRAALRTVAASLPVILSLTAMQQRAHAQVAASDPFPTTTAAPVTTIAPPPTTIPPVTTPLPPTTTPAP